MIIPRKIFRIYLIFYKKDYLIIVLDPEVSKINIIKINIVLADNLLSLFVVNDNKKITKLLYKLVAIYSRSIRRIKLKYLLRYYEKVIIANYIKFKKLNNMFKKKTLKYNNSSSNLKKNNSNISNISNSDLITKPKKASFSYSINKSQPFTFTPQITNKKMAFLMTPCYIVDNDELNNNYINQYNKKYGKEIINGFYSSSPQKEQIFYRTNSSNFLNPEDQFLNTYMKNIKTIKNMKKDGNYNYNNNDYFNNNKNNKIYSARNKIYLPYNTNNGKSIEKDKFINLDIKKPSASEKKNIKGIRRSFFDGKNPKYIKKNRQKVNNANDRFNEINKRNEIFNYDPNDFTLGGENNKNNNGKILTRNKSSNLNQNDNYEFNPFNSRKKIQYKNINREILNHLYENNFMNNHNLRKKDFRFNNNKNKDNNINNNYHSNYNYNSNNNKKSNKKNILGMNTERKPIKKYSIFNNNNLNYDDKNINKSRDYLFPNKQNDNEAPYNKILFNKGLISSSNFSLINNQKIKIPINKDIKKIEKSTSMVNNSNNSNTQSNNAGLNHVSTNYSVGPGGHSYYSSNRDSQIKNNNDKNKNKTDNSINKKNKNNKNQINSKAPIPLQISAGIVDEYFRDSIGKKSSNNSNNSSNRISLQSLSDSKMMELAGNYKLGEESSSDNYQMNNVIHNKKQFYRNYERLYENKKGKKNSNKFKK